MSVLATIEESASAIRSAEFAMKIPQDRNEYDHLPLWTRYSAKNEQAGTKERAVARFRKKTGVKDKSSSFSNACPGAVGVEGINRSTLEAGDDERGSEGEPEESPCVLVATQLENHDATNPLEHHIVETKIQQEVESRLRRHQEGVVVAEPVNSATSHRVDGIPRWKQNLWCYGVILISIMLVSAIATGIAVVSNNKKGA